MLSAKSSLRGLVAGAAVTAVLGFGFATPAFASSDSEESPWFEVPRSDTPADSSQAPLLGTGISEEAPVIEKVVPVATPAAPKAAKPSAPKATAPVPAAKQAPRSTAPSSTVLAPAGPATVKQTSPQQKASSAAGQQATSQIPTQQITVEQGELAAPSAPALAPGKSIQENEAATQPETTLAVPADSANTGLIVGSIAVLLVILGAGAGVLVVRKLRKPATV